MCCVVRGVVFFPSGHAGSAFLISHFPLYFLCVLCPRGSRKADEAQAEKMPRTTIDALVAALTQCSTQQLSESEAIRRRSP